MSQPLRVWIGRGLIAAGAVLMAVVVAAAVDARWFQQRMERRLEAFERGAPSGTSSMGRWRRREAAASGLVGRIEIERLGISAMVAEGTSPRVLRRGVGHVLGTAYPGERGNVALAGHRDSFFRGLKGIARGDRVEVTTPEGRFVYEVDSVLVVGPRRVDLLADTGEPKLTLVTCYPFYYVGPAPRRFVVVARRTRVTPVTVSAGPRVVAVRSVPVMR